MLNTYITPQNEREPALSGKKKLERFGTPRSQNAFLSITYTHAHPLDLSLATIFLLFQRKDHETLRTQQTLSADKMREQRLRTSFLMASVKAAHLICICQQN